MKQLFMFHVLVLGFALELSASHITGGEMSYVYSGNNRYDFTLKLYMRCNSGRLFNNPNIISVFNKGTGQRLEDKSVILNEPFIISLTDPDVCISNPPDVCYEVGIYYFTLILPASPAGYIVASEVNFRIAGISNLQPGSSQVGATYTAVIPGTNTRPDAFENNSARFIGSDLVIVCGNNFFNYSFAAFDSDNDHLRYSFCSAYQASNIAGSASPALPPPYEPVPYGNGFSGNSPLGSTVSINPQTGMISGVAPSEGIYVVTVCVDEIRGGVVIATQRKDLQIYISFCNIAGATLEPLYSVCRDDYNLHVVNLADDPLITSYEWTIFDNDGSILFHSTLPELDFTFTDTGSYNIKLKISTAQGCTDSTLSVAKVFPGFRPGIGAEGFCFPRVTNFHDQSSSVYGTANTWNWEFGEPATTADVSSVQHPSFTYPSTGFKQVSLTVTNTKGCIDTTSLLINIFDKPPLNLAFRDTLICLNDRVQLLAYGSGVYSWTPGANIMNANSASPVCFPSSTGYYVGTLNAEGCINKDSVLIRVVDHVSISVMPDTIICSGDPVVLRSFSDGFRFNWTPGGYLDNATLLSPTATITQTTRFTLVAGLGGCEASRSLLVSAVPYPEANAGADTTICFSSNANLHGYTDAPVFNWSPPSRLSDPRALNPVASPRTSVSYILYAYDNKGCPKPGTDTVTVTVLPKIRAWAGNDTAVIINQPLQLHGSGGTVYSWSPPVNLSSTNIADPTAVFYEGSEGYQYKLIVTNEAGCKDSAYITIKVFTTGPEIFVPSAFTPNGDGLNDIIRPVSAGIRKIESFHIYNRFGKLVYNTTTPGEGWDGRMLGQPQDPGSFVWIVKAIDHLGRSYINKGAFTLIR